MKSQRKNVTASVHQRLLNLSRQRGIAFNRLMLLFAIERLLYRLSISDYADRFVLKGAILFMIWSESDFRPTRDLDLLGFGDSSNEALLSIFQHLCQQQVIDDGLTYEPQSVHVSAILVDQEYQGQRIELMGRLGSARIPLQIDVGFGDVIWPPPIAAEYPTLLDFPSPQVRIYSRESVIAEKFHAMVTLDLTNSRMKDFYDIWTLLHQFTFDGVLLTQAIDSTFGQRGTPLPIEAPLALTTAFSENPMKVTQWQAFLRRNQLEVGGASFAEVVAAIARFLLPPMQALATATPFTASWSVETGWR